MAEIRFSCPACHQHITCDEAWAGQQIQCPGCSKSIAVPPKVTATAKPSAAPPAAAPAQPSGGSLVPKVPEGNRLALNQNAQQPAQTGNKQIPIRTLTAAPTKKEGPWKSIGIGVAIVVILGVGGYFGWPYISGMFGKKEAPAEAAQPAKPAQQPAGLDRAEAPPAPAPAPDAGQPAAPGAPVTNVVQSGPVIPAVYTLESALARVPSGRVNGKVSGSTFVPDTIRIDALGTAQVLRLSEGELLSPERELLVYLHFKPGEKLQGKKIEVTAEQRTRGLPQVSKRWKTNPKYAPTLRSFSNGYVLKLEFNQHANGVVKGQIYLALPDTEQTVAAGHFTALTTIPPEGILAPTALPTTTTSPQPGAPQQPMSPEMRQRYGR